jgi:hypothetical protein
MALQPSIRIEGGLLGPDIIDQLLAGDLPGQRATDFGLEARRNLTDEIAAAFADARALWGVFQRRLERLPADDLATSVTRDAWVIPFLGLLGYDLRYNQRAYESDGLSFAISHRAGEADDAPPVQIVGMRQELGRVPASGRPRLAPHSLVQEYLNRTEQLWGIVTNGQTLRLLRDSTFVRRQAYVEFDLPGILEEQRFQDFAALYRLLHRTRLPQGTGDADQCLLEKYYLHSVEQGGRVRDHLRDGVEECLKLLANGFLRHPANDELRRRIRALSPVAQSAEQKEAAPLEPSNDAITPHGFYRQLLILVYRFLFLLVSEDRGLLSADPLYRDHYGIGRLRRLLDQRAAFNDYDDLWQSLRVLWLVLIKDQPQPALNNQPLASALGLPVLNGELFSPLALDSFTLTNGDLLAAFWHLAWYQESRTSPPRRVNYAALDVEELGSVYESLLEFHPAIDPDAAGRPVFRFVTGSERKTTGSYYTPPELVGELIKSALEPVIADRLRQARELATSEVANRGRQIHANQILSRPQSVAAEHATGRGMLPSHAPVSKGGTLRDDFADSPGSSLHSRQHRRGVGAGGNEGIHPIPQGCPGQPQGTGDAAALEPEGGFAGSAPATSPSLTVDRCGQDDAFPDWFFAAQAEVGTDSLPPYSLLAAKALLSIRVCDPACGSGHFLLAAARRLGKELARVRTGEDEPSPERVREAIRDVVSHSIYGVDKNPLAVDLCRVALWLESHTTDKPLTFLDHRIRCGDSLVGVFDLDVLNHGIPDEAFKPLTGDDKETAKRLKAANRAERRDLEAGQRRLVFDSHAALEQLQERLRELDHIPDDSPQSIRDKKELYQAIRHSALAVGQRQACDLWTAAFFQKLVSGESRMANGKTMPRVIKRQPNRLVSGESRMANSNAASDPHSPPSAPQSPLAIPHSPSSASHSPLAIPQSPSSASHSPLAIPHSPPITSATLADQLAGQPVDPRVLAHAAAMANECRFFHWPLEFPEVFAAGGFDVVLSNPPWERIKLQEQEFFATRDARITAAPNKAARERLIKELPATNPTLHSEFTAAVHAAECTSKFLRQSGRFPFTGTGDINTYAVFAETIRRLLAPLGRGGAILPTGIATDATCQNFFADLNDRGALASLFDFENRDGLFPAVDSRFKFVALTLRGVEVASSQQRVASSQQRVASSPDHGVPPLPTPHSPLATPSPPPAEFAFFLTRAEQLHDRRRRFTLTAQDLALFNPNTRTCPVFRTRADAELTRQIYQRVPVLVREGDPNGNPWGIRFMTMFHMSNDSKLFVQANREWPAASGGQGAKPDSSLATGHSPNLLPLYEAKLMHQFDHRWATYQEQRMASGELRMETRECTESEKQDPHFIIRPRYWVAEAEVLARLASSESPVANGSESPAPHSPQATRHSPPQWLLGFRDITNATNERTAIFSFLPRAAVGNKIPLLLNDASAQLQLCLLANGNSLPLDFVARQKVGGTTLNFFIVKQFPVLPPDFYSAADVEYVGSRVLELVYTAWDLQPLFEAVRTANGDWRVGPDHSPLATRHSPFPWNEERRAHLRAELDAWFARAYGLTRKQLRYILDPADLTERELEDILDPWEEVADPLEAAPYAARCAASDFPSETFRVLKTKELAKYGEYRTRRLVLEAWQRLPCPNSS